MTSYYEAVIADSPVSYWRLGDPSGLPQDDRGVNDVTIVFGTPIYGVTGALSGDSNKAMTFDGSNALTVPWNASLQLGDVFSFEFWFKRASIGSLQWIIVQDRTGGENPPMVGFTGGNNLDLYSPSVGHVEFGPVVTNTSAWHHAVVTKNGSTSHWYLDGVQQAADPGTPTTFTSSAAERTLFVAENGAGANGFDGSLDEIAFYNTALSSARVLVHYQSAPNPYVPPVPPTPPYDPTLDRRARTVITSRRLGRSL